MWIFLRGHQFSIYGGSTVNVEHLLVGNEAVISMVRHGDDVPGAIAVEIPCSKRETNTTHVHPQE